MYKFHKWLAVTVGAFVLMWLISGILITLPWLRPYGPYRTPPVDFQAVTISPAGAVAKLGKVIGETPQVTSVDLRRMGNAMVYKITLQSGASYLVGAGSGQLFTITAEIAKQMAQDGISPQVPVREVSRITKHNYRYMGPIPAYRLVLGNDRGTILYVVVSDGRILASDRWSRLRSLMLHMHTFNSFFVDRDTLRRGLLVLVSVVGVGAVGTGYYLAYPRRRKTG